jgi:hypothetical protein
VKAEIAGARRVDDSRTGTKQTTCTKKMKGSTPLGLRAAVPGRGSRLFGEPTSPVANDAGGVIDIRCGSSTGQAWRSSLIGTSQADRNDGRHYRRVPYTDPFAGRRRPRCAYRVPFPDQRLVGTSHDLHGFGLIAITGDLT